MPTGQETNQAYATATTTHMGLYHRQSKALVDSTVNWHLIRSAQIWDRR